MRVAMVILEYAPVTGGAQLQLASVAPLLQQRGIEVHVLTRGARGLAAHELLDGVPVHRLPAPGPKAAASLCFTAAALARLAALRPDVVHAYSLFSPATIAVLARKSLGAAAVVKVLRGGRGGDVERLRAKLGAAVRIRALRRAVDGFLAISDEIDTELESLGIARARRHRIPNGVDTDRFRPIPPGQRGELRRTLRLPEVPTAVYCGRLVREKRVDLLLEAWKALRARRPECALVVVGDGPEARRLHGLAGDGVRFAGRADDVLPYLQSADAFVLPSDTEGLSNALLEAMAVGLPVVATRVGAAAEIVSDPRIGRLVAPGDARALCDALEFALFDPARAELGSRARARVVKAFALTSIADALADLYRGVRRSGEVIDLRRGARPRSPRANQEWTGGNRRGA